MPFIGTPIDTRNTFQSLQGKRFNGDGSTTAFTLDVAPSSTLDIEVFVGNVRQDPNSAYTLSGTTLTFTGAPPSGTNNIYVVHQAKSVGTINAPGNSITSDQLNTALLTGATDIGAGIADADLFLVDDGAGGTLRKTAASRIKTYIGDTGKILQVVGATDNTQKDTSATSYADTGLSASITPSSSSNKVLIIVHHGGLLKDSSNNAGKLQLLRGTTAIHMFENDFGRDGGTGLNAVGGSGTVHLDSPNTTSETTYKTQIACSVTAASTVRSGQNNAVATMTLMEVSA
jgi:hypothetical protein